MLGSAMLAALVAGPAMAADIPVKARPLPPPPVYNWTGCFVGVGVGYGMFNRDRDFLSLGDSSLLNLNPLNSLALFGGAGLLEGNQTFGGRGWLGTAQFGCDYQPVGSNWVIGAFVDADWTNIRGDQSIFGTFRGEAKLRSSWAVGGRIGWLVTPNLLTFFSVGYTQANFGAVDYVNGEFISLVTDHVSIVADPGARLQLASQRYNGFFLGSGVEYAIGWWPGLFWKSEYRFADYRSKTTSICCFEFSEGPGLAESVHPYVQTVRSELVWRHYFGRF